MSPINMVLFVYDSESARLLEAVWIKNGQRPRELRQPTLHAV